MLNHNDASLFYALLRFREASLALQTTLKLELVDVVGEHSWTATELGDQFGFTEQATQTFFPLLVAMQILQQDHGRLKVSAAAAKTLDARLPSSRSAYLSMGISEDVDALIRLLRSEETEARPLYGTSDGPQTLMDIEDVGAEVANGLASRARNFAQPLAAAIARHSQEPKLLADIGAGSPYVTAACLAAMPTLESAMLVDLPNGMRFAREIGIRSQTDARGLVFCEQDFFLSVPAADVYTISNTAHDWLRADYLRLMHNVRKAIHPAGFVCIHEPLLLDSWSTDAEWLEALWLACYGLTLFKLTKGQGRCYSMNEHDQILRESGFTRFASPVPTVDGCTALFYRLQ